MTTYTYDDRLISDLHKDARNFRPTADYMARWRAKTPDEKQREWDGLCAFLDEQLRIEARQKEEAVKDFEDRVAHALELGAVDREAAVKWIAQAENAEPFYGNEELEWKLGLPYGYIKETRWYHEARAARRKEVA